VICVLVVCLQYVFLFVVCCVVYGVSGAWVVYVWCENEVFLFYVFCV